MLIYRITTSAEGSWTTTLYTRCKGYIEASYNGDFDIVKLLLISQGANIHDEDKDNSSCLFIASEQGNLAVEYLLSQGANIHDKKIMV